MAVILIIFVALLLVPSAQASPQLALQDDGVLATDPTTLLDRADEMHTRQLRIVVMPDDDLSLLDAGMAEADRRGFRVQATVLLKRDTPLNLVRRVVHRWPNVDSVSIGNEPELNGWKPCSYARRWRQGAALVRREFPGVKVGYGELSPAGWDFVQDSWRCRGPKPRADYLAVHPYQFISDPMAVGPEQTGISSRWLGMGALGRLRSIMRKNRKHFSTRRGFTVPIQITEFAYMVSGQYSVSVSKAERWTYRAYKRAENVGATRFTLYGVGEVHEDSSWGTPVQAQVPGVFETLANMAR